MAITMPYTFENTRRYLGAKLHPYHIELHIEVESMAGFVIHAWKEDAPDDIITTTMGPDSFSPANADRIATEILDRFSPPPPGA